MFHALARRSVGLLWGLWYPLLSGLVKDAPVVLLNYGYADATSPGPRLDPADEPDRACIQLYHRVASAIDLTGLRVLEVSSGHGGGASYVSRYLKPRALHGIDLNPRAINLSRRRHQVQGLTFSRGSAMSLAFPDGSFDAVINVEASHCYPSYPAFLGEVRRVLRPGGQFLHADFRDAATGAPLVHRQIEQSGLDIVQREDISADVVRGMRMNHDRYTALIHRLVPRPLWNVSKRFAGVEGSVMHRELQSGEVIYFRYLLRKPTGPVA